ncbi:MAG TPA: shikimate dehydrogenase, partial [Bacteroidetes bacterium]|nr:shikimate dehydrogenase [Bacteroidota bacterium]
LGTGGAARAAAHVLRSWEIWPTFVSRSQSNEDTLRYADLDHRVIQEFLLIINASPVGQRPDVEQRPLIPYESIGQEHLVFDMVYNPVKTSFLRAVEQQGAKTLDGMTMLQGQAKASWKLWQQGK